MQSGWSGDGVTLVAISKASWANPAFEVKNGKQKMSKGCAQIRACWLTFSNNGVSVFPSGDLLARGALADFADSMMLWQASRHSKTPETAL